ncbi:MAG: hypothetical protein AAFY28_02930 [Actinomycetota bacterium]
MHNVPAGSSTDRSIVAVVVAIAACCAVLLWATWGFMGDDSHITFTYSKNLADGVGLVFNQGKRTLSTTTPLTAVVMAGPSLLGLELQPVGILVSTVAAGAIALLLWVNLRPYVGVLAALLGIAAVVLHPFTVSAAWNEMLVYTALALATFHAVARRWFAVAGLLAGFCALTRPDGGLVVVIALAIALLTAIHARNEQVGRRWRPLVRSSVAVAAVVTPWLVFSTWYYGSPVPVTLRAKQAQRESGHGRSFVELVDQRFDFYFSQGRWVVAAGVVIVGLVAGVAALSAHVRQARSAQPAETEDRLVAPFPLSTFAPQSATLILALAWNLLIAVAYLALDVSAYGWYVVPFVVTVGVLTSLGAGWLVARAQRWSALGSRLLGAAIAVAVVVPLLLGARDFADRDPIHTVLYQPAAEWMEANVPSDAAVGTLEVGLIGYYSGRTIVDFAGLLQPDAATDAELDQGFDAIAAEAWNRYQPEFVAMLQPGIPTLLDAADFAERCVVVHTVTDPAVVEVMDIYDCRIG